MFGLEIDASAGARFLKARRFFEAQFDCETVLFEHLIDLIPAVALGTTADGREKGKNNKKRPCNHVVRLTLPAAFRATLTLVPTVIRLLLIPLYTKLIALGT